MRRPHVTTDHNVHVTTTSTPPATPAMPPASPRAQRLDPAGVAAIPPPATTLPAPPPPSAGAPAAAEPVVDAPEGMRDRPLTDLSATGLLWLINRVVFHPRGFALFLAVDDGQVTGWGLHGDGTEVWHFADAAREDRHFANVEALFRETAAGA